MPQPSQLSITSCLLSLASNIEPAKNLAFAYQQLSQVGQVVLSSTLISSNDLKQSTISLNSHDNLLLYHNQVAYLKLYQAIDYWDLVKLTKDTEQQANRGQFDKPLVTLDVDIVAIHLLNPNKILQKLYDEKGQSFIHFKKSENWLGVARRFPLASYDKIGIEALKMSVLKDADIC